MGNKIRKISVGVGFPNDCIYYQVGKPPFGKNVKGGFIVSDIILNREAIVQFNKKEYDIYISSPEDTVKWKTVEDVPVVIEYDIDFN
jgi:hypothetical protein